MKTLEKMGWLLAGTVVWGALSTLSTVMGKEIADNVVTPMVARNANVFNQMADTQGLNDRGRARTWTERQATITREIGMNGSGGFDWIPFFGKNYVFGLLTMANKNQIALVPGQQGQDTTLIIDKSHGCLLVDFTKGNAELANEARRVLSLFTQASATQYDYHGRYKIVDDRSERHTTPLGLASGSARAADYCPAPTLR
ncbi:hypothetical protein [Micavibrio aeruginosavorus]|uniref:hypothetical protein n=1 Tax=Micavibrio aeruginosavorus TaxID=349221 RepID=UPI003F4AB065